jgi:pimeloyl-ACP methyl ester carboxylesterase
MQRLTSASFSPALRAWLERGRHLNVCGRRVFVIDSQTPGPLAPVLLLHGYPTSSFDYHLLYSELSRQRRVVLLDLPGFGFSDKPERYSYSLFEQTDIVESLLVRLGIEQPHIVGHDFGANIACELLARRQRRLLRADLSSMTIMSSGVYSDLAKTTVSQKLLLSRLGPAFAGLRIGSVFDLQIKRVFARPVSEELISAMWELIVYQDGHKRLPQIAGYLRERERFEERWITALRTAEDVPLKLLWGTHDPTSVIGIGERLEAEVPGAELTRLMRVGHYPHVEAPEEVLVVLRDWFERHQARPASSAVELSTAT